MKECIDPQEQTAQATGTERRIPALQFKRIRPKEVRQTGSPQVLLQMSKII